MARYGMPFGADSSVCRGRGLSTERNLRMVPIEQASRLDSLRQQSPLEIDASTLVLDEMPSGVAEAPVA